MKRTLLITGLLVGLISPPAFADEPLDRLLSAIDTVPTRAALDAQWDDAASVLMAAARDGERSVYERHRAVTLLSFYPDARTRAFLVELARERAIDSEVRKMSVYTLGRAFGATGGDALVTDLRPFVQDDDPVVREWAVRSLRWVRSSSARTLLREIEAGGDAQLRPIARRAIARHVGADGGSKQ